MLYDPLQNEECVYPSFMFTLHCHQNMFLPKKVKETDKNKANNKITQKIIISGFLS